MFAKLRRAALIHLKPVGRRNRHQALLGLGTGVVTLVCAATMVMQITPMISIATT
jgi:hypothetical protein